MVRLIKESFSNDRYEEAQNYIDNGMTTWREIFQDCSEIARTDKELKQSMIDQCGSISKYAEEIFDAVQDILGNEANESVKRNKRVKEDFTVTDADYGRDIAEEVANIMQDMDWQDSLDDSYDNPDEAWDAYVDQVLEQLESDPQEVIDWLEDEGGSDVHSSLIRNIIKCFGGSVSESIKKKNSKSLKENLDGVDGFAVEVHDMGKGYIHLFLYNIEEEADNAYDALRAISDWANDGVDADGYEFDDYAYGDAISQVADEADEIVNEVDWRREIDSEDIWTAADETRYKIIGRVSLYLYW